MSHELVHILEHSFLDTLKLVPFLFLTYLLMEFIEHKTSSKVKNAIHKSGKAGPLIGGLLGAVPQCGFSASAAGLYAGRVISLGTLIAIFLSTSDEMLPILISEKVDVKLILQILGIKVAIGMVAGFIIDFVMKFRKKQAEEEWKIHDMCEYGHCNCEKSIWKSALKHTLQIVFFILIVNVVLNGVIEFVSEESLGNLFFTKPVIGELVAGLVGLIPNCASSVIITQLFLEGVISFGSMMSGLLVGSGVGVLVLFRVNESLKDNLKILALLYTIGVGSGILLGLVF